MKNEINKNKPLDKTLAVSGRFLFLDDIRFPYDVYEYTHQPIFLQEKWVIARDYNDFVEWITKNGLPEFISFDHDLADYEISKEEQGTQAHTEKQDSNVLNGS